MYSLLVAVVAEVLEWVEAEVRVVILMEKVSI
jgi:hypothetical protein